MNKVRSYDRSAASIACRLDGFIRFSAPGLPPGNKEAVPRPGRCSGGSRSGVRPLKSSPTYRRRVARSRILVSPGRSYSARTPALPPTMVNPANTTPPTVPHRIRASSHRGVTRLAVESVHTRRRSRLRCRSRMCWPAAIAHMVNVRRSQPQPKSSFPPGMTTVHLAARQPFRQLSGQLDVAYATGGASKDRTPVEVTVNRRRKKFETRRFDAHTNANLRVGSVSSAPPPRADFTRASANSPPSPRPALMSREYATVP